MSHRLTKSSPKLTILAFIGFLVTQLASADPFQVSSSLILKDPSSNCSSNLTVAINTTSKTLNFYQRLITSSSCVLRPLELGSFYPNQKINSSQFLNYTSSTSSHLFASLDLALLPEMTSQSSCILMTATQIPRYLCNFISSSNNLFIQIQLNNLSSLQVQMNPSLAPKVVDLKPSCSSNKEIGSTIDDLYSKVYITPSGGMKKVLTDLKISHVLVKSRFNKMTIHHQNVQVAMNATQSCIELGMTFNDFIKDSVLNCSEGCDITFLLTTPENDTIYTLLTTGFFIQREIRVASEMRNLASTSTTTTYPSTSNKSSSSSSSSSSSTTTYVYTTSCCYNCNNCNNNYGLTSSNNCCKSSSSSGLTGDALTAVIVVVIAIPVMICVGIYLCCKAIVIAIYNFLKSCVTALCPCFFKKPREEEVERRQEEYNPHPVETFNVHQEIHHNEIPKDTHHTVPVEVHHEVHHEKHHKRAKHHEKPHVNHGEIALEVVPDPMGYTVPEPVTAELNTAVPLPIPVPDPVHYAPAYEGDRPQMCMVCNVKLPQVLFSPCNHTVVCYNCVEHLMICPVCNEFVQQKVLVHLPKLEDYKRILPDAEFEAVREQVEGGEMPCLSCLNRKVDTVAQPCGHMFGCEGCMEHMERCMICSTEIMARRKNHTLY